MRAPTATQRFAFMLAIATTMSLPIGAALAEERWATYLNPRFGAAADYPADLFTVKDPPPENGDGQTFHTADGRAELSIYGSYNIDGERPEAYVQRHVSLRDVTYKKIGADFYAVSGTRGATVYYERCNFPDNDMLSCFYVSYPAAEKAKWDPIVTRIGRSLRLAQTGSQ
jgi:hypothetical protein